MKKEYGTAFVIITVIGVLFVTLSGSVFSGYHFMDCNDYYEWGQDLSEMSWWKCLIKHVDGELGQRFRPAWQLNVLSKTLLFGDNMLLQGFWQLFLNLIAAFLIYWWGRRIQWSHKESLLVTGISMIGTQSAVFYQTLAIETPALIVLLLSWHCIISYFNTKERLKKILSYLGFIVFSLLAALMKENFILVLPASYLLYCMQYNEKYRTGFLKSVFHTGKTGLFLAVIVTACLWAVITFAGNDFGYAGINQSINLFSYFKSGVYLYGITGCLLAFIGLFYLYRNKKITRKEYLFPGLLFLIITIPQILIYGKSNIIDRYLIPAVVGCAYFSVFIYREIKKRDHPVNERLWKNISLILGIIVSVFCGLIIFDKPFREGIVQFAVRLRGEVIQTMTSVSGLQYLTDSLSIIGITGFIIGCVLLLWGIRRNNYFVRNLSRLYAIGLLLVLFMNAGLAFASCKRYAMRGFATESFLKTIVNESNADDVILVAGNPWVDMEGVTSGIYMYLSDKNRKNLFICPITNNPHEEEWIPAATDYYHQKDIHAIKDKDMIRIIAVFPGSETVFAKNNDWFEIRSFDRYEFPGNFVVYVRK